MGGEREQQRGVGPGKSTGAKQPTAPVPGKATRVPTAKTRPAGPIMDQDGEILNEAGRATEPGEISLKPSHDRWEPLANAAETVTIVDDVGDSMRLEITYRLESRPGEIEGPNIHIVTKRRALLTLATGEHVSVQIAGQAIALIGVDDAMDPKRAVSGPSIGPDHTASVYIPATEQYINFFGHGGDRDSLAADAADSDLLAYDDPLRMLMALKRVLKQQRVAGQGVKVAKTHDRVPQILAAAEDASKGLREHIAAVKQYLDGKPGEVSNAEFVLRDLANALSELRQQGREGSDDYKKLADAHRKLVALRQEAMATHAPEKGFTDHLADVVTAPVRLVGRVAEGVKEAGAMAVDTMALGVAALGKATGGWDLDWKPISDYGKWADQTGASSMDGLSAIAEGFVDSWSNAIERAGNGDYSALMDVGIDTALMVDGARTTVATVATKTTQIIGKAERLIARARTLAKNSRLPAEVRDIATAIADSSRAFVEKQRAAGMQMAGGPDVPTGPTPGSIAEGIDAAKATFVAKRAEQAKGRALDAIKKRLGKDDAPDAAEWVTRVEATFAGDSKKAIRFFRDVENRVSDPAPFMRATEELLSSSTLSADQIGTVLNGVLDGAHADPTKLLREVQKLAARNLAPEVRALLIDKALGGTLDLDWLARTKLTDADLSLIGADTSTDWRGFQGNSDLPSAKHPGDLAGRPPNGNSVKSTNAKVRGIAAEQVAEAVELPGGLKIRRRIVAGNSERTPDYELVAPDGSIAEMEVKAYGNKAWPGYLDQFEAGDRKSPIFRMLEQLDSAVARGHKPYLAITDHMSGRSSERLMKALQGRLTKDQVIRLPESEIKRAAAELRSKMAIPQPGFSE